MVYQELHVSFFRVFISDSFKMYLFYLKAIPA